MIAERMSLLRLRMKVFLFRLTAPGTDAKEETRSSVWITSFIEAEPVKERLFTVKPEFSQDFFTSASSKIFVSLSSENKDLSVDSTVWPHEKYKLISAPPFLSSWIDVSMAQEKSVRDNKSARVKKVNLKKVFKIVSSRMLHILKQLFL